MAAGQEIIRPTDILTEEIIFRRDLRQMQVQSLVDATLTKRRDSDLNLFIAYIKGIKFMHLKFGKENEDVQRMLDLVISSIKGELVLDCLRWFVATLKDKVKQVDLSGQIEEISFGHRSNQFLLAASDLDTQLIGKQLEDARVKGNEIALDIFVQGLFCFDSSLSEPPQYLQRSFAEELAKRQPHFRKDDFLFLPVPTSIDRVVIGFEYSGEDQKPTDRYLLIPPIK